MEFHEKLQELRRQKGLTQEELAGALFVSRTAVSKWESGRGYPNIDSLRAIAKFFSVTVDALLSGEEILAIAEEDQKENAAQFRALVSGALDVSVLLFFFLPLFGETVNGTVQAVCLLSLTTTAPYLKVLYCAAALSIALAGVLTLVFRSRRKAASVRLPSRLSLGSGALGTLLFIVGSQPYAAAFLFVFLAIKAMMLMTRSVSGM